MFKKRYLTEALQEYDEPYFIWGIDDGFSDFSSDMALEEDLDSSFPVTLMSESEIRAAAKKIVKGAKVRFGYVNTIKLAANYAQGKFSKKDNIQYPLVKVIRVSEMRACTSVNYNNTSGAKLLHATQQYQDKLAARKAAGLGGFGTSSHDTEVGLENILITTATGLKCVLAYPMSNGKVRSTYYISIDGEDWRGTDKQEIVQYMTPADGAKFISNAVQASKATYQSNIRNALGQSTYADTINVIDSNTGERIKVETNPMNITYFDPNNRFKGIYALDKESAIVADTANTSADLTPLDQDFPNVDIDGSTPQNEDYAYAPISKLYYEVIIDSDGQHEFFDGSEKDEAIAFAEENDCLEVREVYISTNYGKNGNDRIGNTVWTNHNKAKSLHEDNNMEIKETLQRYLDVEIPDICKMVLDNIDTLPEYKQLNMLKLCQKFYNYCENLT